VSADSDFIRHTTLLGLKQDNKWGRLERAMQNKFCLFTRERARHPASKKFFLEVVLNVGHVTMSRRIIREDDASCQSRHVSEGKTVPQIERKERIVR